MWSPSKNSTQIPTFKLKAGSSFMMSPSTQMIKPKLIQNNPTVMMSPGYTTSGGGMAPSDFHQPPPSQNGPSNQVVLLWDMLKVVPLVNWWFRWNSENLKKMRWPDWLALRSSRNLRYLISVFNIFNAGTKRAIQQHVWNSLWDLRFQRVGKVLLWHVEHWAQHWIPEQRNLIPSW